MPTLLLLLFCLFSTGARVNAECQCPLASPEDLVEQATYVFQGKLTDFRTNKKTGEKTMYFEINDVFKGDPKEEIGIVNTTTGTDCAVEFKQDENYLVYALWEWGTVVIKPCSGTKRVEEVKEEAKALGPGDLWKQKVYPILRDNCLGRRDTPCCLSSVKAMRKGNFLPEPEAGCPDGTLPDRLRCQGSLRWCIPVVK